MSTEREQIARAARIIAEHWSGKVPAVAVVLGSGLGDVVGVVQADHAIDYSDLPGFPVPTVAGHRGRLVLGHLGRLPVAVLQGRGHYYESANAAVMSVPLRALGEAGCEMLLMTNAAGSLRREVGPGSLAVVTDHINLTGANPLIGHAGAGDRSVFVDMTDAYDQGLRSHLAAAAAGCGISLPQAVYACFSGPSFETPAEIRAAGVLGADLAGMSLVPETIIARHAGLRVAALSVVTNYAAGVGDEPLSHEHTMEAARAAAEDAARVISSFLSRLEERHA